MSGYILYPDSKRRVMGYYCLLLQGQGVQGKTLNLQTSVTVYHLTCHNVPQDINLQQYCCQKPKP